MNFEQVYAGWAVSLRFTIPDSGSKKHPSHKLLHRKKLSSVKSTTQQTFNCSKSTTETPGKGVKYVQK